MIQRFNQLFVVWVLVASVLAWVRPDLFTWFRPWITPGLGLIMLGMGITLVPEDFRRVVERWPAVLLGVAAQYGLMPLSGFLVAKLLGLGDELTIGVVLLASCPGGTASNVIAYLGRADVALSISMTTASTLLSPLLTPSMIWLYAGEQAEVAFLDQATTIAKIIVLPVLAGLAIRIGLERSGRRTAVASLLHVFPAVSVIFIVMIVACIVGLNADRLGEMGPALFAAVVATNALGLSSGYLAARGIGFDRRIARTVAIEVGMQNSGLGVALAGELFSPVVALPSALFSLWHNITGPALASWWSRSGSGPQMNTDQRR